MKYLIPSLLMAMLVSHAEGQRRVPRLPPASVPRRFSPVPSYPKMVIGITKKDAPFTSGINVMTGGHYCLQDCCKGVSTILAFGASFCMPCRRELPELIEISNKGNVKVLYVSGDSNSLIAKSWLGQAGVPFPVIWDTSTIHLKWGVESYPTCFLIGPDGKVESYLQGYNSEELKKMVEMGERLNPKNMDIGPLLPPIVSPLLPEDTVANMADVREAEKNPVIWRRLKEDLAAEKAIP